MTFLYELLGTLLAIAAMFTAAKGRIPWWHH